MISALEEQFTHVVKRLTACWGDPAFFDLVFADLMLDQRGGRSGWPFDAWLELVFLQEVHDLAYGVAKYRTGNAAGSATDDKPALGADYNWVYDE